MPGEIWHIIFFCLTMTNPECVSKHDKVWGISLGPFHYYSEEQCTDHAEGLANIFFNEKGYQMEYACRRQKDWTPYVARRRE